MRRPRNGWTGRFADCWIDAAMNFTIPIYIDEKREAGRSSPQFTARPLFFPKPLRRGESLQRVQARLAGDLRRTLVELARRWRHDELAEWAHCPEFEEREAKLTLRLKRATLHAPFLLISVKALGRRVAFTPSIPDLCFEVRRGEDLATRAEEVLTHHYRELEKEAENPVQPDRVGLSGRARVVFLELSAPVEKETPRIPKPKFAMFGGDGEELSGAEELERIGRSLHALYPDELDRASFRETEVEETARLLDSSDRRPVLLLGPAKVGKTAILHEAIRRGMEQRRRRFGGKRQVWLLSPQRLISGMMYVGQWERRLLAILKEAGERDHVLYFDDLLGLYLAGLSASSDLNAAQVLKPHVEQRRFRMLAEMTPEAFRKLREKDRAFADLFHVIPVRETNDRDTRRILIAAQRRLEGRHRCRFELDAIPATLELQRRYASDQAFPGKAAGFLAQLAAKQAWGVVSRATALMEFQATSGLSRSFIDAGERLARRDIVAALATNVIGQAAAVEALADTIATARARLNDPGRPLGSLLFLGPTGVGKTQCAKAAAEYLFGDASRLVRFDMNEFVDGLAVAQLVGTFREPEGLLTSAVRRQPFCVLLFDEIEKAHPAVFDALLAVLGEGRLTDALGRTANFANCIVILTSNLGVREAGSRLGFRPDDLGAGQVFVEAAEKFFRPEFFNRLDRVVPFAPLAREHIQTISRKLIADVFARDGLRQRRCVLQIHEEAMARLVEKGYHPKLGARALKRVVEKHVARPLAVRIAEVAPGAPMTVTVFPRGEEIATRIQPLVNAERAPAAEALSGREIDEGLLDALRVGLRQREASIAELEPAGAVPLDSLSEEQKLYFALREQFKKVETMVRRLDGRLRAQDAPRISRTPAQARRKPRHMEHWRYAPRHIYKHLAAAEHMRSALDELAEEAGPLPETGAATEVAHELALLDLMRRTAGHCERVALAFKVSQERPSFQMAQILIDHHELCDQLWGIEAALVGRNGPETVKARDEYCLEIVLKKQEALPLLQLSGAGASEIARAVEGTHLILQRDGRLTPVLVFALTLAEDEDPRDAWRRRQEAQRDWMAALARGEASADDDPLAIPPVVRRYEENGPTLDLRLGFVTTNWPDAGDLRTFLLAQLPPPGEFQL